MSTSGLQPPNGQKLFSNPFRPATFRSPLVDLPNSVFDEWVQHNEQLNDSDKECTFSAARPAFTTLSRGGNDSDVSSKSDRYVRNFFLAISP